MAKVKAEKELYFDTTDGNYYVLNPDGTYDLATVDGAALITDQQPGITKTYPDITFSGTAATLTLDPPADVLVITPVQGDAAADAKWVFCTDPVSAAFRDAQLDISAVGVRYTVQMQQEKQVFKFSSPISSIGYDGYGTPGTTGRVSVEAITYA